MLTSAPTLQDVALFSSTGALLPEPIRCVKNKDVGEPLGPLKRNVCLGTANTKPVGDNMGLTQRASFAQVLRRWRWGQVISK